MSPPAPQSVTAAQRPLPLVARSDISAHPIVYQQEQYWVVKDPLKMEYFRLQPEQYAVLRLLDGHRSAEEIRSEFTRQFPAIRPTLAQLHRLIFDLFDKGLVWSSRPGQDETLNVRDQQRRRRRQLEAIRNVLFIRFPGWDPQWLMRIIYPLSQWILHPTAIVVAVFLIGLAWSVTILRFDEFQQRLPSIAESVNWNSLLLLWIALGAAKLIHELAHAVACRRFGGECHEIGFALLVFSPCLYCDVSDSWTLPSKWRRMAVSAAGVYVELTISAIALLLWWNAHPGWTSQLLLSIVLVTHASAILFNLNPFLRLDGYYLLSDWLEIPNLRQKSDSILRRTIEQVMFGVRVAPDPLLPRRGKLWFGLFAICSACYRWFMLVAITFVLYQALRPYGLQNFGFALGCGAAVIGMTTTGHWLARLIRDQGEEMRKSRRPAITATLGGILLLAAMLFPLPIRMEAPFVVEPHGVHHIYAQRAGKLVAVHVKQGDHVESGQLLAELSDWKRVNRHQRLTTARDLKKVDLEIHRANGDATQAELAQESLRALNEELTALESDLAKLRIVAPCAGRVIAPPETAQRPLDRNATLPTWSGTPLDKRNTGCSIESGSHLMSLAPSGKYDAVVLIDPLHRHDFETGQAVRMRADHLPTKSIHGVLAKIATNSIRLDGASTDNAAIQAFAKQHLAPNTTAAYVATVPLPVSESLLLPGVKGRARIRVANRSAVTMLLRYMRNTFHFQL